MVRTKSKILIKQFPMKCTEKFLKILPQFTQTGRQFQQKFLSSTFYRQRMSSWCILLTI